MLARVGGCRQGGAPPTGRNRKVATGLRGFPPRRGEPGAPCCEPGRLGGSDRGPLPPGPGLSPCLFPPTRHFSSDGTGCPWSSVCPPSSAFAAQLQGDVTTAPTPQACLFHSSCPTTQQVLITDKLVSQAPPAACSSWPRSTGSFPSGHPDSRVVTELGVSSTLTPSHAHQYECHQGWTQLQPSLCFSSSPPPPRAWALGQSQPRTTLIPAVRASSKLCST